MSAKIDVGKEAQTALEWAFGAYADKDPGVAWEIILVSEMEDTGAPITREDIDALAARLIQTAVTQGLNGRICLGWCTYRRNGQFGLGVMGLKKAEG